MSAKITKIGNDTELDRILNRDFVSPARTGYVEVGEAKISLPVYYEDYAGKIEKFQVRDDDVFLIAHPKTGTTWLQEMLWLIVNDLDYEGAKERIYFRSPQLELAALFDIEKMLGMYMDMFAVVEEAESPRVIKSHLHWSLLPAQIRNGTKQPKIISILRNPEDVCVSLYHHSRLVEGYKGTFDDFCKLFIGGRVCFGPFWKQVLSCWEQKDKPNVLILRYKDVKNNLHSTIGQVAKFLGKNLTEEQIATLAKHLSFDSMKNNDAVNNKRAVESIENSGMTIAGNDFIRSGKVGGYKNVMSVEQIEEFKSWTEENLKGTGLTLD